MRGVVASVALAGLLVLAGCNTVGPTTPTVSETVTPASVPTDSPTPVPELAPGLTRAGVTDPDALAGAHASTLAGESFTYRFSGARRVNNTTVAGYGGTLLVGRNCSTYAGNAAYEGREPVEVRQWYADGETVRARTVNTTSLSLNTGRVYVEPEPTVLTQNGEPRDPCAARPFTADREATLAALYRALNFDVTEEFGGYTLTSDGGVIGALAVDDPAIGPVENVTVGSARIHLAPSGRVESFQVSYVGVTREGRVEGSFGFRVTAVGETEVTPPWPAIFEEE